MHSSNFHKPTVYNPDSNKLFVEGVETRIVVAPRNGPFQSGETLTYYAPQAMSVVFERYVAGTDRSQSMIRINGRVSACLTCRLSR